jgi:hypothetical protein
MSEAAQTYINHWHILKLRLIETRRILLSGNSLFEFEYAAGQQRKIIEGIAQSWVLALRIRDGNPSTKLQKSHKPNAIYNQLRGKGIFPISACMSELEESGAQKTWKIEHTATGEATAEFVVQHYEKLHRWQHSFSPNDSYPFPSGFDSNIKMSFRNLANENQKIWNAHVQHIVPLNENWFLLDLCSMDETTAPRIIQVDSSQVIGDYIHLFPPIDLLTGWATVPDWGQLKQRL